MRLAPKKLGKPKALTSLDKTTRERSQEDWSAPVEDEVDEEADWDEGMGYLRLVHASIAWSGESQTR